MAIKKRNKVFKPKNISMPRGKDKMMKYRIPRGVSPKYQRDNRRILNNPKK